MCDSLSARAMVARRSGVQAMLLGGLVPRRSQPQERLEEVTKTEKK